MREIDFGSGPLREPGRPRELTEAGSRVTVWLEASAHDRLADIARVQRKSISRVVRELLTVRIPKP